ncbi:type I-E CRISPR-associated protein Cas5/CasD [Methylocystis sp. WRRC1]|uniref:type I-E CRISPR-associated protein Cas5/CasD n=1 Tax=Methylocystis sp. WRRC1 TaxID=1732014 RepID=UPI001D153687|nr:type I-E CRISPR-associated protein Cas5/CasD [Methylocystis sp. WRRC1]MCC3246306.1 type I-E CRISPR-associated protein Cas5/CasD [Methylocystis sp. WRRC1]
MPELLMFQLVAPIGAFGAVAVGERRETAPRPSHSGLIGLLGASLGLERADPRQPQFSASLAFASRRDRLGPLLADYHTAQTPPARKGRTWATRREELSGEVNTILSRRDYHADCAFSIACLPIEETVASLHEIAEALRRPMMTLYLGRKSCPLCLPPDPLLVQAKTLRGAFDAYDAFREDRQPERVRWRDPDGEVSLSAVFHAHGLAPPPGVTSGRREQRRDVVVDRRGWRFDLREEIVLPRLDTEWSGS